MHLVPSLPPASLTPEQPPTEPLTQGKIKKNQKSVVNHALLPLWKKRVRRASFVISVLLLNQDLRQRGIITTLLELFCTIIYHSELIFLLTIKV